MAIRAWLISLACVCSALVGGCDNPPVSTGDGPLGRPDATHGPPTDADIDGDGVANDSDICPSLANADQMTRCDYDPPPEGVTSGLDRLNFWRAQLGLASVTEDTELSRTCQVHLDYLQRYASDMGMPYYLSGEEDMALPYYTMEGATAGAGSVLSYGRASSAAAVDGWLDTLYNRLPLIHPGLSRVGVAYDSGYTCLQFRAGTDAAAVAPHPIRWPVADSVYTRPFYPGGERPCATADDPLADGMCPMSAAIATLGLHGSTIEGVMGVIVRLDTMEELPLHHIWFDGGPSPHETMGYLEGTIALVPEPGAMLARATYEVSVLATIDGVEENIRWRFALGAIDQTLACDLFGPQGSFMRAVPVTAASINGRVCETSDFYRIRDAGTYAVTLQYDRRVGALELIAYDAGQTEIGRSVEHDGTESLTGVPGMTYLEVRGAGGQMGGYILVIE